MVVTATWFTALADRLQLLSGPEADTPALVPDFSRSFELVAIATLELDSIYLPPRHPWRAKSAAPAQDTEDLGELSVALTARARQNRRDAIIRFLEKYPVHKPWNEWQMDLNHLQYWLRALERLLASTSPQTTGRVETGRIVGAYMANAFAERQLEELQPMMLELYPTLKAHKERAHRGAPRCIIQR